MAGSEGFFPMPVREGTGLPGREETFVAGAMAGASMMMFLCCSTCMTFIVLIIGVVSANDACDKPLANYLIVQGAVGIFLECVTFCHKMTEAKVAAGETNLQGSMMCLACCCMLPGNIFTVGWNIHGVVSAFGSQGTGACTPRLYYTSMVSVWMFLIISLMQICAACMKVRAQSTQKEITSSPGSEEIAHIANSI